MQFIHNDAVVISHDYYIYNPPDGPEKRLGTTSITNTGSFYDGGFTTEGIITYAATTDLWITGSGSDEPEAVWNATYSQCTWVDHAGWLNPAFYMLIYPTCKRHTRTHVLDLHKLHVLSDRCHDPSDLTLSDGRRCPVPDRQMKLHGNFLDSSIDESINPPGSGGTVFDGSQMSWCSPSGVHIMKGSRLTRGAPGQAPARPFGHGGVRVSSPAVSVDDNFCICRATCRLTNQKVSSLFRGVRWGPPSDSKTPSGQRTSQEQLLACMCTMAWWTYNSTGASFEKTWLGRPAEQSWQLAQR